MVMHFTRSKLKQWMDRINQEDIPAFAHTARSMASISVADDRSANDLANAILKDSAMTTRVLRMANSVYYNPTGRRIHTVSYAIVLLGFTTVRNLAMSISLIDTVLNGACHDQALKELVKSFHAAVQARALAELLELENLEYVFIAALLHRLGQMMFWCFPYGYENDLIKAYREMSSENAAEKQVLGFTLKQLTVALTDEWRLSDLLSQTLSHDEKHQSLAGYCVNWGHDIAESATESWPAEKLNQLIENVTIQYEFNADLLLDTVETSCRVAARNLRECGIVQADSIMPFSSRAGVHPPADLEIATADVKLAIMRQLTHMLSERQDVNAILSAILEGIFRALNMDHVLFAWVDVGSQTLQAKQVLGTRRDYFLKNFHFSTTGADAQVFSNILFKSRSPCWHNATQLSSQSMVVIEQLKRNLGTTDFFCFPIYQNSQPVGLIYADRSMLRTPLTSADFDTFIHFCDHASIAFQMLLKNKF